MKSKGEVSYANLSVTSSTGLAASTRTACYEPVASCLITRHGDMGQGTKPGAQRDCCSKGGCQALLSTSAWGYVETYVHQISETVANRNKRPIPVFHIIRLDKKNNLTFWVEYLTIVPWCQNDPWLNSPLTRIGYWVVYRPWGREGWLF